MTDLFDWLNEVESKLPRHYPSMSQEERREVRRAYQLVQNGNCAHCKKSLSGKPASFVLNKRLNLSLFPKDFLKWPIHLHHNHETGMTIGAVHAKCNAVLWQYHGE